MNKKIKSVIRISVVLGVISFLIFITVPPTTFTEFYDYQSSEEGTDQFTKVKDSDIASDFKFDDVNPDTVKVSETSNVDTDIHPVDLFIERQKLQSLVNSNIDFIESDNSKIQNFFDGTVELPNINGAEPTSPDATTILPVSDRFVLETVVVKFDSNQVQTTESDLIELDPATEQEIIDSFNFDTLSLVDSEGNLLDLGAVQVGFFGVVNTNNEIDFSGKAKFMLDDRIVGEKHFGAFGDTVNKKLRASLSDTPTSARSPNFTFTFADEGADWQSGEVHTFRVVITDIKAQVQDEKGKSKFFTFNGAYTAYRLEMKVDDSKRVVIDDELDKAVSVFIDDGRLIMRNTVLQTQFICGAESPVNLEIKIRDRNGVTIGGSSHNTVKRIDFETWNGDPSIVCQGFEVSTKPFIPRNAELRVTVFANGISDTFTYISPKIQHNVNVFCSNVESLKCTSNIGWSYP